MERKTILFINFDITIRMKHPIWNLCDEPKAAYRWAYRPRSRWAFNLTAVACLEQEFQIFKSMEMQEAYLFVYFF